MADNLPLLPEKGGAVSDARAVLREVFRELDFFTPCGDAASKSAEDQQALLSKDARGSSGYHSKLHQQELDLQMEYAKRLAREPLPNIHQLQKPASQDDITWHRSDIQILRRKDLKPSIDKDAGGNKSLWVRNILTRSSGDLAARKIVESGANLPIKLEPTDAATQSASIGELISHRSVLPPPLERPRPQPTHVVCIPPGLNFVNFTVGQVHTKSIRLVNVSKLELRLSVRPPTRPELSVELCSRLVLASGSAAEMKVHLRAGDVRALSDRLLVRVSSGQTLLVPIACYLEPPLLYISIPSASVSCVSPARMATSSPHTLELGAALLGDVHRAPCLLRCSAPHAVFFLMSRDSWDCRAVQVSASSSKRMQKWGFSTDCFYFAPVRWSGGGSTRGLAVCRARRPGMHTADLMVLSSTATVRSLTFLADALLFSPDHVTLEAHEKDYDICSEDDPACEYYVHLGTAFPHRSLQATVKIINKSPLIYNYYWSSRPWGVCSCWEQFQRLPAKERKTDALCSGAMDAKKRAKKGKKSVSDEKEASRPAVLVTSPSGNLTPHSETTVNVQVPDVGDVGEKRAVLILILQNVPQDSFPSDYVPKIIEKKEIQEKSIPGVCESWSRTVCDVVCAQLEVWWRVVPVRFALEPPLLLLPHSRRVMTAKITLRSTQLCGACGVEATWCDLTPAPPPPALAPLQCALTTALLPLGELPDQFPQTHLIQLVATSKEHSASCRVQRWCSTRHPALRPTITWLGVQPPGAPVATQLTVLNDTHQKIYWWASVHRVCRERGPLGPCVARAPCAACCSRACAADALSPSRGALWCDHCVKLRYCVNAPDSDGCVVTLVRVARTAADTARAPSLRGTEARAALLAYRVLAPRLVLRVKPCRGDKAGPCEGCALDEVRGARGGSPVLRPRGALALGGRSCCRLQLTNLTPQPTRVTWEPTIEGEDVLAVTFVPNEIQIGGHDTVEILLVLEARAVCARRVFVRRARVDHAQEPLYLLIDAAISGVKVIIEFPIGGEERTDSYVKIPMLQKELSTRNKSNKLVTSVELFAQDDCKRALQKENSCHCHYKNNNMIYIPPTAPPAHLSPVPDEERGECSSVEILKEPPPLTRVCPCAGVTKPQLPEDSETYCLQFRRLPLRTVRSHTILLHNSSRLEARFCTAVRRWPRRHTRTIDPDQWAGDVCSSGVVLEAAPATGSVAAQSSADVIVSVYADCWGVYHDQILIEVEHLEPLVVDVWVEAVGPPLQLRLSPAVQEDKTLTLWLSCSDAARAVRITNMSRAHLSTDVFLLRKHERPQDTLPFRLYLKFLDVVPRTFSCYTANDTASSKLEEQCSSRGADTDIELFLAPDLGLQTCDYFFQVEPQQFSVAAGEGATLTVRLQRRTQPAPAHALLLRSEPAAPFGAAWHRPPPPLQVLQLREAQRSSRLQVLCSELRVTVCALDLPCDDILRVRKKFSVKNTGGGSLEVVATTEAPWRVDLSRNVCDSHCVRVDRHMPFEDLKLNLLPRSSIELFAEVSVRASEVWPAPGTQHPPRLITTTDLRFHDLDHILLLTLPLVLELELPLLHTEPPSLLDFGFVSDGSTKKSYFTVSHSSRSAMDLTTQWIGDPQFRLYPPMLSVPAGASARVYVQYTASWMSDRFSEGRACVLACGAARAWCRVELRVRARATRPRAMHGALHTDHTDDAHLLPEDVSF